MRVGVLQDHQQASYSSFAWGFTHLDVQALIVQHLSSESPSLVKWTRWDLVDPNDAMCHSYPVIILAERRRLLYNTRTSDIRHIGVRNDSECSVFVLRVAVNNSLSSFGVDTPAR